MIAPRPISTIMAYMEYEKQLINNAEWVQVFCLFFFLCRFSQPHTGPRSFSEPRCRS